MVWGQRFWFKYWKYKVLEKWWRVYINQSFEFELESERQNLKSWWTVRLWRPAETKLWDQMACTSSPMPGFRVFELSGEARQNLGASCWVVFSVITSVRRRWAGGLCTVPGIGDKSQEPGGGLCNRSVEWEVNDNDCEQPWILPTVHLSGKHPLPHLQTMYIHGQTLLTSWCTITY